MYWLSIKEKGKELLREHKIAFVATRSMFNISVFYGVAKLIVYKDVGMDSISFVRIGFYFIKLKCPYLSSDLTIVRMFPFL